MSTRYQFWQHRSGETYAVRLSGDVVTGVNGPLHHSEIAVPELPNYAYDDNPEDADWANEHADEFSLVENATEPNDTKEGHEMTEHYELSAAAREAIEQYHSYSTLGDVPDSLEHTLYQLAAARVDDDPELAPLRDIIIEPDWKEGPDHYEWVLTAPRTEILNWAQRIRDEE